MRTWNTGGVIGSVTSSQISREMKSNYFSRLVENNNIICLQEVHRKDEFLQTIQVLALRFRLHDTLCIHEDLLPHDAVVTRAVTCQGRDHIVNVRSGCQSLIVVNIHFEPELTLRNLRERLSYHPHWPQYPDAIGMIMGLQYLRTGGRKIQCFESDSLMVTRRKLPYSFFTPRVLVIVQPDYKKRDSSVSGIIRSLSRIDRAFINLPMAETDDFHRYFHVFRIWGKRSIPSDHAAVRVVIHKPTMRGHQGKRFPNWMSKHLVFCPILKQINDDHHYVEHPFGAPANLKNCHRKREKADGSRALI